MTHSTSELRAEGASEFVLAWRRWRRGMRVTQPEAAAMAGLHERTVMRMELGWYQPRESTRAKLQALMARWTEQKWPAREETRGRKARARQHEEKRRDGDE